MPWPPGPISSWWKPTIASNNLFIAAQTAASLPGVSVVSMSWGGSEQSADPSFNSQFAVPGVTFLASTGDDGAPGGYPAYSPNVVAVGGTSLQNLNAGGDLSRYRPERRGRLVR